MSQPKPLKPGEKDNPGAPISGRDELVAYFASGEKPRSAFRVGTEHEKFGFLRDTLEPLPFDGPRGIEAILDAVAAEAEGSATAWTSVKDDGRTIALMSDTAGSITLEPGGQLELSGAPLQTVHETCREVGEHLRALRAVCLPRGVGFIGIGFHPTAKWEDMPRVPKGRYGIMQAHMPKVGSRGLDMMKRTATIQANFDYENEADMVASFRTGLALTPIVTALFANSPFVEGSRGGALSERTMVWQDTDADRTGFPSVVFEDGFGYERWADYVLDVPMYFVRRDGIHHDHAGASFRSFMERGLDGHVATMRDFEDHLTTAFPEVRLKKYLEVRGADGGPWSRICALTAIWKGVLYDTAARDAALALMEKPTAAELAALQADVGVRGFKATYRGRAVLDLARDLLAISAAGLTRIGAKNARGEDETRFLRPLFRAVERGQTFAERLLEMQDMQWGGKIEPLFSALEFFPEEGAGDAELSAHEPQFLHSLPDHAPITD